MTQPPRNPDDDWPPREWGEPQGSSAPGAEGSPYLAGPPGMPQPYLIPAILVTLLCCLPTGIPAIVFASQVSAKYNAGDVAGAEAASGRARTWVIISIVAGLVATVLFLIVNAAGTFTSGY